MTAIMVYQECGSSTVLVGHAYVWRTKSQLQTTFIYDPAYVASSAIGIDSSLALTTRAQHHHALPRVCTDGIPDQWGRNLIVKAEEAYANELGIRPRQLDEVDFLLRVSDNTRQGNLRFALPGQEGFLGPSSVVPKLISLPALLHASDAIATSADPFHAIKALLDTGTTGLGGARPKAAVQLEDGSLAIAKFPHPNDTTNVMAWEATTLDLHQAVGITTPAHQLVTVGGRDVVLLRRFDRTETGGRVGYMSAMTALGAHDGEHHDYRELAEAMRDISHNLHADLSELFDRVVVSVALRNTDDHLRNHGFLATEDGWELSPVFDVNPNPNPWQARTTSIMGTDAPPDEINALLSFAPSCNLTVEQAKHRMRTIAHQLHTWRDTARSRGIALGEIRQMEGSIQPCLDALGAV